MARRQHLTLLVALCVIAFLSLTWLMSSSSGSSASSRYPKAALMKQADDGTDIVREAEKGDFGLSSSILKGGAIAPKLENKTIKAELGRASWKLLHTMMAKFPEKPSDDESLALKTYIQLFARLYPCGECAAHFQKLLAKYPPQTSSRNAAAGWACFVHNQVNKRLEHAEFDCNKIGDFYDCGCGDENKKGTGKDTKAKEEDKTIQTQKREPEAEALEAAV